MVGSVRAWKRDEQGRPMEWEGGYLRYNGKGRATYYVSLMRSGQRYHYAVARKENQAHIELEKFEADPSGYRRRALSANKQIGRAHV